MDEFNNDGSTRAITEIDAPKLDWMLSSHVAKPSLEETVKKKISS